MTENQRTKRTGTENSAPVLLIASQILLAGIAAGLASTAARSSAVAGGAKTTAAGTGAAAGATNSRACPSAAALRAIDIVQRHKDVMGNHLVRLVGVGRPLILHLVHLIEVLGQIGLEFLGRDRVRQIDLPGARAGRRECAGAGAAAAGEAGRGAAAVAAGAAADARGATGAIRAGGAAAGGVGAAAARRAAAEAAGGARAGVAARRGAAGAGAGARTACARCSRSAGFTNQ